MKGEPYEEKIIAMVVSLILFFSCTVSVFAAGDGNVEGGGGGMGGGTGSSSWSPGMDGVRVSVVNAETGATVGSPIDYTEKTLSSGLIRAY